MQPVKCFVYFVFCCTCLLPLIEALSLQRVSRLNEDSDVLFPTDDNETPDVNAVDRPINDPSAHVDPFNENSYSDAEKNCLSQRKFLVGKDCYALNNKGPCKVNELLLLEKPIEGISRLLRPVCKTKPCNNTNEVFWPKSGKCETKTTIEANDCKGKLRRITSDPYGDGICVCIGGYGEIPRNNQCYEYYQQGPCSSNEVVTYDPESGHAVCSLDKCLEENRKANIKRRSANLQNPHHICHYKEIQSRELEDSKESEMHLKVKRATLKKKKYAPLEGKGKCYKLNSAEPCTIVDEDQSRYVIDQIANVPRCSVPTLTLHVVDAPVLCRLDDNRMCRDQVKIKQEDRVAYLLQFKNKALNRSKRKLQ